MSHAPGQGSRCLGGPHPLIAMLFGPWPCSFKGLSRSMTALYDVAAIGNAIVDVIAQCDEDFLAREGLVKGSMALIDPARAASLYDVMAAAIAASGGSAANSVAGVASFGGRAAFIGKVADDQLGDVFRHDMK